MYKKNVSLRVMPPSITLAILGVFLTCATPSSGAEEGIHNRTFALENSHIRATFLAPDGACRLNDLARIDGDDALRLESDEFEIVLFDKSRATIDQYETESIKNDASSLIINLKRRKGVAETMPAAIRVTYTLGEGPYLYKDVSLKMKEGQKIDRLEVMRFSSDQKATRGGDNGQPVFVGNWFFGINYPCFYSRHSDDFIQPNFKYRYHFTIDLENGDKEYAPRKGLVSLFHFPGLVKKQNNGWLKR